jgi:murein DD-endopeptidase MepM/ murein hydrolase activator NlpD
MFVRISERAMAVAAELLRSRICPRAIALMLLGFGAAGCSADPNGAGNDPYRTHSETTGSVRSDQVRSNQVRSNQAWADGQAMAQILRPPMPVPEAPVSAPAAAALPADAGIHERDGLVHGAPATARSRPRGTASGRKPIKLASRSVSPPPEAAKSKSVAPQSMAPPVSIHEPAAIVIPEPKPKAPPASEVAVVRPPPARPAESAPAPSPALDAAAPIGSLKAAEAGSTFYWPVHGQLLAGYGAKINGQQNNGINVAVPEDTPVKAADDGVVLYAGNGLKTYGNLLLVRHANGYVTVYAHSKELLVKVGDEIKRGQVIAKSGKTGEVDRPQIHFEIRKASAPVNPMPYLNGA